MTQEELKPCPFCGSSDLAVMELLSRGFRIECAGCEAYSPVIKDGPSLLTAWNTRASDAHPNAADYRNRAERAEAALAEVRAEVERLRQALLEVENHAAVDILQGYKSDARWIHNTAKAALNGGKHD